MLQLLRRGKGGAVGVGCRLREKGDSTPSEIINFFTLYTRETGNADSWCGRATSDLGVN